MSEKRHVRAGLSAVTLLVAALAGGCGGGSSTPPKPLGAGAGPGSSSASTSASVPAQSVTSTTAKPGATSGPTAAQIAAVQNDLDAAGNSLAASDSAIGDSDVTRAQAQEGSAP